MVMKTGGKLQNPYCHEKPGQIIDKVDKSRREGVKCLKKGQGVGKELGMNSAVSYEYW